MTHVSLFSGVGGIDLAAEWAGFRTVLFCERDKYCRQVLKKHWPDVPIIEDIKDVNRESVSEPVALVSGGDPCPIRSRARGNRPTKHADLSGYFLAVVGLMRPRWVLRENVPAPDVVDFETALDVLGYRTIIVTSNAVTYTGQWRTRDFIVGCSKKTWMCRFLELFDTERDNGLTQKIKEKGTFVSCLTAHEKRYDGRDSLVFEGRLRVIDKAERTKLAGFPAGWVEGMSNRTMARLTGNAVVPQQVYPILRAIAEIEK